MRSEDNRTSSSAGWAGTAFDPSSWTHLDGTPRHDLALAFARTEIAVYGLKYGVEAPRPNGSAHSFPSGHTAAAFMGAEFIRQEYGWQWGVPAYVAASFVGWSRIVSGNHWPRDLLAGAAIGILSNYDLDRISTRFGTIEIKPLIRTVDASGLGRPTLGRFADDTERPLRGDATPMLGLQVGFRF